MRFRTAELICLLHQDEATGINVIAPELDVTPLERHEFSAAQTGELPSTIGSFNTGENTGDLGQQMAATDSNPIRTE